MRNGAHPAAKAGCAPKTRIVSGAAIAAPAEDVLRYYRGPTKIVTVASPLPTAFVTRYWNVNAPVKPLDGRNATPPFAFTVSSPLSPNATVSPAGNAVTDPPSEPPPKDEISPAGTPFSSFASRPGAGMMIGTSRNAWNGSPGTLVDAGPSFTGAGASVLTVEKSNT